MSECPYTPPCPQCAEAERLKKELGATQAEVVQRQDDLGRLLHAAEAENERLRTDGLALHKAYLRLRALIPGAFKTPHAPTPEQVWETTERALTAALTAGNPK